MKLKLTLHRTGRAPVDLAVTAEATATVGDLASYLARADPDQGGSAAPDLTIGITSPGGDGVRALDPRDTLAASPVRSGSSLTITRSSRQYRDASADAAVVTVLSGPGRPPGQAPTEIPIAAGTSIIGREDGCEVTLPDPLVSRQHARITVTDVVEITDLGSSNGLLLGSTPVQQVTLGPDETVRIGDTVLAVRLLAQHGPAVAAAAASSVSFVRSPRLDPVYVGVEFTAPEPPEPANSQRFPALTVLVSLLMGGVLFAVTRSLYSLTFIALSPLLIVATSMESRVEARNTFKRALELFRADLDDLEADATLAATHEVFGRNQEHPAAADCVDAVRSGTPLLWARRVGEHGFTEFRLGTGRQAARNTITIPEVKRAPRYLQKEVAERVAPFATVDPVPVVARPAEQGAIGLAGPRPVLLGAARSLLVQAAALHSPAELVIAGVASTRAVPDWDWLKWLPHTSSGHSPVSSRLLASDGTHAEALIGELRDLVNEREEAADATRGAQLDGSAPARASVLLLVDHGAEVEHSRLVELAERGWRHGVHVLWLAPDLSQLPAACRTFVELGTSGSDPQAGFVHSSERVLPLRLDLLDAATADEVAHRLSPLVDIGAPLDDDSDLPRSVSLLTLLGPRLASDPRSVIERWNENSSILTGPFAPVNGVRREGTLRAVVGQASGKPHLLDLRSDGPHALVGGTTGSGKSELLQAWILAMAATHSPQRLTFLLIDYKGGSAFNECVDLPHTINLVTDLNPHLVRRAMTSLSAELRYRERILARHKAKDLVTLEKAGQVDTPPSLVIVVDEFAALATDVPQFVEDMVDVAQRGRSLGLHLILATQRPAGVIKENLRANTNLRLALRVADEDDSTDVLGSPQAAYFDQDLPGRAVSKTGPGRLVPFQAGYAGGHTTDTPPPPELAVEELRFGTGIQWAVPDTGDAASDDDTPTDISRLVASIKNAGQLAEIPTPRDPWLPELRNVYDLDDPERFGFPCPDTNIPFGVLDDPENQAQPTIDYQPDVDGNLAVFGTGGTGKSTLLRTIGVAAGLTVDGSPCHVYGLDFGSRGLDLLAELPHVGSIIRGTDHERIGRLLSTLRATIDDRAARYAAASAGTITEYRRLAQRPDEPRIIVLVDGINAFTREYEAADLSRWFEMFLGIATDGRPVGVHVVVSCEQRSSLPPALASSVQRRIVLRMAAAEDYTMLDVESDVLRPGSPPGRGLAGEHEVQVAVLGGTVDVRAQAAAIHDLAETMRWTGVTAAPPIERLPDDVRLETLPATVQGAPVIAVASADLGPWAMPSSGSFLLAGPRGSGRSTALTTIVLALRRADPTRRLFYFGQRRSQLGTLDVWNRRATTVDEVNDLATELAMTLGSSTPAAVVIEDVGEFLDGMADLALQDLARAVLRDDHLLVVDGESSAMGSAYGLLALAKTSRSGLALHPGESDGQMLYRTNFPRPGRGEMPPGRGIGVRLGRAELIQVARVDGDS